ncbi:MAG: hypothetical protein NZ902_03895 [Acidilobaceae archaeon]|nr:hypothetical protein [Acidilobaceae archaeon]MDW7974356.1 hypothetical protein [Sulfolobales archaeon]
MRKVASALVLALMLFPLAVPLLDAYIAQSQGVPVVVYNRAISPGSELAFYVDRQLGQLFASPVLHFFLSRNATPQVEPADELIASINVVGARYVVGTLLVPATVTLPEGSVYLKVSNSNQVGSSAVVSANFTILVKDAARLSRALRLTENVTVNPADIEDLAFFNLTSHGFGDFRPYNRTKFIINMTALGVPGSGRLNVAAGEMNINITLSSFLPCPAQPVLVVSNVTTASPQLSSNFLYAVRFRVSPDGRIANFTGRIGNFSLACPASTGNIGGITVGFQRFNLGLVVTNGSVTINAGSGETIAEVKRNNVVVRPPGTSLSFRKLVISLELPNRVSIYPTTRFSFANRDPNEFELGTARITPGDNLIVDVRNFRRGGLLVLSIYVREGALFAPLTSVRTDAKTTDNGSASVTVSIPAAPFGGREAVVTANLTVAGDRFAVPAFRLAQRVLPAAQFFAFNNNGTRVPTNFTSLMLVPGEIFVVRGVGYNRPANVTVDLMNGTIRIVPIRLAFRSFDNGSFVGVYQIPSALRLYQNNVLRLRVYVDSPVGFNNHNMTGTTNYGAARVFIEPRAGDLSLTSKAPVANLSLGAIKFPFEAAWEVESSRVFNLLVYGFSPGALRFNVSLLPSNILLLSNVPRNGTGSLELRNIRVPTVPSGNYRIQVNSTNVLSAVSNATGPLTVRPTAAARDPADLALRKEVFLPVAMNLTVRGVAFAANQAVKYDIPAVGITDRELQRGPSAAPVGVSTDTRGVFEGWINLPVLDLPPGTYIIRLRAGTSTANITVRIGTVPSFRIDVVAESSPIAEVPASIWVIGFYGGSLAQLRQISSIAASAYLRVGAVTQLANLIVSPALGTAPSSPAVYFASFDPIAVFGADAKGRAVVVMVEARARFVPGAPEDAAVNVASIFVPARSLSEELRLALRANLSAIESLISSLSAQLSVVRSQIAANLSALRGDLSAFSAGVRANLTAIRGLLVTVNDKADAQIAALITANDRISAVVSSLSRMNATVVSGFAAVRTDIAGLAALMRAMNASLRDLVVSESGAVRAAIVAGRDAIIGVVRANASALAALIRAVDSRVESSARSLSDALAAFRSEATSRMDSILSEVGRARTDIAAVGAGVTTVQSVLAEVRTTLSTVNDRVVGIRSVVDSVNAAMAGVATKSDLAGARDAVNSRVAAAESSLNSRVAAVESAVREARSALESQIQSSQDSLSVNARNWGIINAVLVVIAIALLAYSIFVARKP